MHVTKTSETQSQTEQPESTAASKRSTQKSILALSVFALGLNATAAVYTIKSLRVEGGWFKGLLRDKAPATKKPNVDRALT